MGAILAVQADILLKGISGVALKIGADFNIIEVQGTHFDFDVGADVRDVVPALLGMEDVLAEEAPELEMPFVQLSQDHETPVALNAIRDGAFGKLWLIVRDVSEEAMLRQTLMQQRNALAIAQEELMQARDAALFADRAKTAFLANVSHELRTPLQVVIGGSSILAKADATNLSSNQVVEFAADIRDSGTLLLELVDDLIDLSRAETGDLKLYEEWFSISQIGSRVASLARGLPMIGRTKIDVIFDEDLSPMFGDSRRFKQILLNLLSNAVKAVAQEGQILLRATKSAADGVVIEVSDDGPGMSDEGLALALEPFGQPDPMLREMGSGLGLPIVQSLVELHGGAFEIITAEGEGLTARIIFGPERFDA